MIRCLLIDDEKPARVEMRRLLQSHAHMEIVGEAANVKDAIELTASQRPEVVFLDIKLRGETGFDYVGRLPEPSPKIVFVTAFDRYAMRGFECNALDYLVKPVHPERLAETIKRLRHPSPPVRPAEANDAVFLKIGSTSRFVPWREVHHIQAEGNHTRVFFENGPSMTLIRPLKQWVALAPKDLFIQIHRTALIRRDAVRQLESTGNGQRKVILSDGAEIPVGRAYWPGLRTLLRR